MFHARSQTRYVSIRSRRGMSRGATVSNIYKNTPAYFCLLQFAPSVPPPLSSPIFLSHFTCTPLLPSLAQRHPLRQLCAAQPVASPPVSVKRAATIAARGADRMAAACPWAGNRGGDAMASRWLSVSRSPSSFKKPSYPPTHSFLPPPLPQPPPPLPSPVVIDSSLPVSPLLNSSRPRLLLPLLYSFGP